MFKKYFFIIFLLSFANSSFASWVEVKSSALIENKNIAKARATAINIALKKASLSGKYNVSFEQEVINGKLTKDRVNFASKMKVVDYKVLQEKIAKNKIYLTLQVNLLADLNQCKNAKYKKAINLKSVYIDNIEQAQFGQIFEITKAIKDNLLEKLNNNIDSKSFYFASINEDFAYDIYLQIKDISIYKEQKTRMQNILSNKKRNFVINLDIKDKLNKSSIYAKTYQTSAPWKFKHHNVISPFSAKFKRSDYGIAINQVLDDLSLDIHTNISCAPFVMQITKVNSTDIEVDLENKGKIIKGDEFELLKLKTIITSNGSSKKEYYKTGTILKYKDKNFNSFVFKTKVPSDMLYVSSSDLIIPLL